MFCIIHMWLFRDKDKKYFIINLKFLYSYDGCTQRVSCPTTMPSQKIGLTGITVQNFELTKKLFIFAKPLFLTGRIP